MKLEKFFRRAVEFGISADPRGKKEIEKLLKKEAKRQEKLEGIEKELADEERTWNPFGDSRILYGDGNTDIKNIMVGIDIETAEVMLADRLREKGDKIDAIVMHHPEGRALADLDKVMAMQIDVMAQVGVPVTHAEAQLKPRTDRIWRAIHADNLFRTARTAELMDFPLLGFHTVSDNLVWKFMERKICKKEYDSLEEILNVLLEIPEYKEYAIRGNPPILVNGCKNTRPGKVVATEFTGGTNGPEEFLESQSRAGVGTVLSMHVPEKALEVAKKHHVNMVQCSHIASDSIGLNLLLDKLNKEEKKLSILETSGFVRVKR